MASSGPTDSGDKRRRLLMRLIVVAFLVALLVAFRALPLAEWLTEIERWVSDHPVAGPLAYIGLATLAGVAATPAWIPMMLAGLVFGLLPGVLLACVGMVAGATAGMLVGRTLARSWVEKRIQGNRRLMALDDALQDQAFVIVALTRLAIVIPWNLLNYAYGLTRVGLWTYIGATAVGMLPIIVLYVYAGTLAKDIGAVLAGDAQPADQVWWLAAAAIIVLAIVVWVVRRAVRRALDERLPGGGDAEEQA